MSKVYGNILWLNDVHEDWKKSLQFYLNGIVSTNSKANTLTFYSDKAHEGPCQGMIFKHLGEFNSKQWILVEYQKMYAYDKGFVFPYKFTSDQRIDYDNFQLNKRDYSSIFGLIKKLHGMGYFLKAPHFTAVEYPVDDIVLHGFGSKGTLKEGAKFHRKSRIQEILKIAAISPEDDTDKDFSYRLIKDFIQNIQTICKIEFSGFVERNQLEQLVEYPGIVLQPVRGKKGTPLSSSDMVVHEFLVENKLKRRLLSLDQEHSKFSWLPMFSGLLHVVGQPLFQIESYDSLHHDRLFIGVDVSHRKRDNQSVVCFSVIQGTGKPIFHRRFVTSHNESIPNDIYVDFIAIFEKWVKSNKLKYKEIFFVRDGRFFEKEDPSLINRLEGHTEKLYVLSISKYTNPMFSLNENLNVLVNHPSYIQINDDTIFVMPNTEKDGVNSRSFRVTSVYSSEVEVDLDHIAKVLVEQCYTSRLGLDGTNYPSPIFWSDGVASIKNGNYQFDCMANIGRDREVHCVSDGTINKRS